MPSFDEAAAPDGAKSCHDPVRASTKGQPMSVRCPKTTAFPVIKIWPQSFDFTVLNPKAMTRSTRPFRNPIQLSG
jgi:hypothetical protein